MWLVNSSQQRVMPYEPNSENARGAVIMGIESRLEGRLKSLPLLLRLSRARLTSTRASVKDAEQLFSPMNALDKSRDRCKHDTKGPVEGE